MRHASPGCSTAAKATVVPSHDTAGSDTSWKRVAGTSSRTLPFASRTSRRPPGSSVRPRGPVPGTWPASAPVAGWRDTKTSTGTCFAWGGALGFAGAAAPAASATAHRRTRPPATRGRGGSGRVGAGLILVADAFGGCVVPVEHGDGGIVGAFVERVERFQGFERASGIARSVERKRQRERLGLGLGVLGLALADDRLQLLDARQLAE